MTAAVVLQSEGNYPLIAFFRTRVCRFDVALALQTITKKVVDSVIRVDMHRAQLPDGTGEMIDLCNSCFYQNAPFDVPTV